MNRFVWTTLLVLVFAGQILFGYLHRGLKVDEPVMPAAPTPYALGAMAFGDSQLLYRRLVLDLQNFGDTGGRVTAMTNYPIANVLAWLRALDSLDGDAGHHVLLAARYFSQTQDPHALERLVRYIGERVNDNPERHSIRMIEAFYLAEKRLNNPSLGLELADILERGDAQSIPIILRQMPAFLREKAGDYTGAAIGMSKVLESRFTTVDAAEKAYMEAYIREMEEWSRNPPAPGSRSTVPPPI